VTPRLVGRRKGARSGLCVLATTLLVRRLIGGVGMLATGIQDKLSGPRIGRDDERGGRHRFGPDALAGELAGK